LVRLIGGGGGKKDTPQLDEGSKVEGNYRGKGRWYPGRISRVNRDGTFDIDYDDGEKETKVDESMVRLLSSTETVIVFKEDDVVEFDFHGRSDWVRGIISFVRLDGTYDIRDDRGEVIKKVETINIREYKKIKNNNIQKMEVKCILSPYVIDDIRKIFKKYQIISEMTCRKEFEEYDDENSPVGSIVKKEFKMVLRNIHKKTINQKRSDDNNFDDWLNGDNLDRLIESLSYHNNNSNSGNNNIDYNSFLLFALNIDYDQLNNNNEELYEIYLKLHKIMFHKLKLTITEIIKLFATSKTFQKGYVRNVEFNKILTKISSKITNDDCKILTNSFDFDQQGIVDFHLIIDWLAIDNRNKNMYNDNNNSDQSYSLLQQKFHHQLSMLNKSIIEKILIQESSSSSNNSNINYQQFNNLCTKIGVILSSCEIKVLYHLFDKKEKNQVSFEMIMKFIEEKKISKIMNSNSGTDNNFSSSKIELIPMKLRKELNIAVNYYLKNNIKSLGQLLLDGSEEKTGSINRRQLRSILNVIKAELNDEDENILFDCLEFLNDGFIYYHDLLIYFMNIIHHNVDSKSHEDHQHSVNDYNDMLKVIKETIQRKKITYKDIYKNLLKYDHRGRGYIDYKILEQILFKLIGSSIITENHIHITTSFLDPNSIGSIDYIYYSAIIFSISDIYRCENKLKNCLKIMRIQKLDYKSYVISSIDKNDNNNISKEHFIYLFQKLHTIVINYELDLIFNKHSKKDMLLNIHKLFDYLENEETLASTIRNSTDKFLSYARGNSSNNSKSNNLFTKELLKKIYKLRSNNDKCHEIRNLILNKDKDITGYIPIKDFRSIIDKQIMDIKEEELNLLIENLIYIDQSSSSSSSATTMIRNQTIDYSYFFLMLQDPLSQNTIFYGMNIIETLMANQEKNINYLLNFKRLMHLLYHKFATNHNSRNGIITIDDCKEIMNEECFNLNDDDLNYSLNIFNDESSHDCILYPEYVSYLLYCSIENILYRLQYFNIIRMKQGYNIKDYLTKLMKNNNKIEYQKLKEIFEQIGIFLPDISIHIIFQYYHLNDNNKNNDDKKNKTKLNNHHHQQQQEILYLDISSFLIALDEMNNTIKKKSSSSTTITERKELPKFKPDENMCEIAKEILLKYDEKIRRCLQLSFDLYDINNNNKINSIEIERILRSIGYIVNYNDIYDLIHQIDRNDTGYLEYNDFMDIIIPFLQQRYLKSINISLHHLKTLFHQYDSNNDNLLQPYEIKHVLRLCSTTITQDEIDDFIEFLDIDNDGDISWNEFCHVYDIIQDDNEMNNLSYNVRSILRKIQYSILPDPEELITMFIGLPTNYRVSVLSDLIEAQDYLKFDDNNNINNININYRKNKLQNTLEHITCHHQSSASSFSSPSSSSSLQFEVQVKQIKGCPNEQAYRESDLISRGIKFAIVQTDKPPTLGEPGNFPIIHGNITKIHATRNPKYIDNWRFDNNSDIIDPDKICFIQCSATENYHTLTHTTNSRNSTTNSPLSELYLFIEIYSTFRISDKFELVKEGIKKVKTKKISKIKGDNNDINNNNINNDGNESTKDSDKENKQQKKKREKNPDFLVETRDHDNDDRSNHSKNNINRKQQNKDTDKNDNNRNSTTDLLSSTSRKATQFIKTSLFGAEKSNSEKQNRNKIDDNIKRDNDEIDEDIKTHKKNKMFDMCCGWVMIPILSTLQQQLQNNNNNNKFLKIKMFGGTPFGVMNINEKEIMKRKGIIPSIKRFFGYPINSELEIKFIPILPPAKLHIKSALILNKKINNDNVNSTTTTVTTTNNDNDHINENHVIKDDEQWFVNLLPSNIILPVSAVTIFGIYRKLLFNAISMSRMQANTERLLPQTTTGSSIYHADVILSSFPKIISDEALCHVLLLLWKKEYPILYNNKTYKDMIISDSYNTRVLEIFRNIILKLYIAYSSPYSIVDKKLNSHESYEEIKKREMYIRSLVGIPIDGTKDAIQFSLTTTNNHINNIQKSNLKRQSSATSTNYVNTTITDNNAIISTLPPSSSLTSSSSTAAAAATSSSSLVVMKTSDLVNELPLCIPFHSKELLWSS
jgi:Ca2+-binding EF-hand superfamily protein